MYKFDVKPADYLFSKEERESREDCKVENLVGEEAVLNSKVIDDAFVALENIKTTEEYNYNYGVNKNGASEPNFAEASSYIALYQEFESKVKDAEKYAAENTKKYTFLDGVIDSVFCISVVFAILIILWLIIECFKFIKPKKEQTPKLDAKENTSKKITM